MELLDNFLVPKATGKAFVVKAGQILRITQPDGPQVIDFDAFSLEDPREYLLTSATRRYGPSHVTTGDTLWSGGLRERPMFTIVADTIDHQFSESGAITHEDAARGAGRISELQERIQTMEGQISDYESALAEAAAERASAFGRNAGDSAAPSEEPAAPSED